MSITEGTIRNKSYLGSKFWDETKANRTKAPKQSFSDKATENVSTEKSATINLAPRLRKSVEREEENRTLVFHSH